MNHSCYSALICLGILFPPGLQSFLYAAEPSLSINQTAFYPEKYELRITAHSAILDGFILVKSPERLPGFSPEVASFGVSGKPLPGVSLYGGSISAQGLPARARSPVFSLYSPFYTPTTANKGVVFHTSETQNTRNAAIEVSARNTRIAAIANLDTDAEYPSWVLSTQTFPAFDPHDLALTVSVLAATRVRASSADASESWFLQELQLPETRILMPAVEILLEKGIWRGSCTGLLNLGQLISPVGAIRADGAVTIQKFTIASGFYRSDYRFEDLDGTRNSVLARIFAAPSFTFNIGQDSGGELKWGVLLARDTVRREKYFERDSESSIAGTGLEYKNRFGRAALQMMKKGDETEVASSTIISHFFHPALKLNLSAKTVRTQLTEEIKTENSISSKFSITPTRWFSGSLAATGKHSSTHEGVDYSVSGACSFTIKKPRMDWNLDLKIALQNTEAPPTGSLLLKVLVR